MNYIEPEEPIHLVYSKKQGILTKPVISSLTMKQLCSSCEKYFCLSSSGQVFTISNMTLSRLTTSVAIKKICSNKETVLFVAELGVYYQGYDLLSSDFSYTIKPIESLCQVRLVDAGIGLTHASATDDLGNLYLWGSVYNAPHPVASSKVFTCTKVACGDFITCLTTTGGYFYTYGWFNTLDAKLTPYSFPELERYFIIDFCIGPGFCAVVTEEGLVLAFDAGQDLLPLRTVSNFASIWAFNNGILVHTGSNVFKWQGTCIKDWQLEVFSVKNKFNVLGEVNGGIAVQGSVNWELKKEKIESVEKLMSPKMMSNEKKSYFQYFPQDNTYNKLLEYRKQHKIAGNILQFFTPIIMPVIKSTWEKLKKYSEEQILIQKTQVLSELPACILKVSQKFRYLKLNFALYKLACFARAQARKQKEISQIKKKQFQTRAGKLLETLKKLLSKEKVKHGKEILKIIDFWVSARKQKLSALKTFLAYSKKGDKKKSIFAFFIWAEVYYKSVELLKGLSKIRKIFIKKLGEFAFRHIKSFHFYRSLKLNKLKRAILLLYKKTFIQATLCYFSKWSKIGIKSSIRKEKSAPLYRSLAKNIFSVLIHKYKSLIKFGFLSISATFLQKKLIRQYRNPILYFSTVISKIICRLKFSTFTSIQRLREKSSFTLNLDVSDRLSNLLFVTERLYEDQIRFCFEVFKKIMFKRKFLKNNTLGATHEQVLTFFDNREEFENPFLLNQTVPKLQLNTLEKPSKPPISNRTKNPYIKLPPKQPQRSGSFKDSPSREDSLSRRKNYDNQLRKKIKNIEKFSPKAAETKSVEKLLAKKTPKRKYIEVHSHRDSPKNSEDFFKVSLAVLGLRKFLEKNEFTLMLATFKILKSCFKYSKNPYSRCFRYSPDKSNIFN